MAAQIEVHLISHEIRDIEILRLLLYSIFLLLYGLSEGVTS